MASKGIKGITIDIGGNTSNLDKALKDVNSKSKDLSSELSQVNRLLKLDPNNVTLVKQKQELLTQSIEQTSQKLNTLKDAQKQVSQQYKSGTIDENQYRAFQRELEATKSKLDSLKDEKKSISVISATFTEVKQKVTEATDKLKPFVDGLGKAAQASGKIAVGGIETVGKTVDITAKSLTAYATIATGVATASYAVAASAGAAADDINTLAKQSGLSTQELQKFQYASALIDVDLETLTGSMTKLTRNMATAQGGTGAAAEAFSALGISITDSNGQLRNNSDVFNEAINALGLIENSTQRDALAMQIFGKSAQDLNPLILGGADALKELGDQAESAGIILSQDALDNLNGFNDSIDILKANATAGGRVISTSFAGAFTDLTNIIGGSIPSLTGTVANIFKGDTIGNTLTADLITMGTNLIANLSSNAPQFFEGLNTIVLSVLDSLTATLPDAVNTLLPTLLNGFFSLIDGIIATVPELLPVIIDGAMALFLGLLSGLENTIPKLVEILPGLIMKIGDTLIENLPVIIEGGVSILISIIQGITESLPLLIDKVVELIPVIVDTLSSPDGLTKLIEASLQLVVALAQGLPKGIPAVIKAIPQIIMAIIEALLSQDWIGIGVEILRGLGSGLIEGVKAIGDVIGDVANGIVSGFKSFFGIKSPSRLFKEVIGKNLALGIGEGFSNEMDKVNRSMRNAVNTDFSGLSVKLNSNMLNRANYPQLVPVTAGAAPTQQNPINTNNNLKTTPIQSKTINIQNLSVKYDGNNFEKFISDIELYSKVNK